MPTYILTVLDTTGIQEYIFSANNLKQNAGASYLAACTTRTWVKETLDRVAPGAHNVAALDNVDQQFDEKRITDDGVLAEVIYAGGGNTAILFNNLPLARGFTGALTQQVLLQAPGLHLAVAHQEVDWGVDALGGPTGMVQAVMQKLKRTKAEQPSPYPLRGLGVTVDCAYTNRPAVGYDQDERPLSVESWAKHQREKAAEQQLKQVLGQVTALERYSIPRDFEDIGSTHGESSYIAVIHVDGNGMGQRIEAIRDQYPTAGENRAYINAMRAFSLSVQQAANGALQATAALLLDNIKEEVDQEGKRWFLIGDTIRLQQDEKTGKPFLPFRPLVFGGDDGTFVCEGRLGLQLAAYYLNRFSGTILDDKRAAHCRSGVAVVHAHYPFALAYALAERLCSSAKTAILTWSNEASLPEDEISALDWHFAINGMNLAVEETRRRDYTGTEGNLLMRPVRLNEVDLDWRSWRQFRQIVQEFQGATWQEGRNKLLGLREPLRQGPQAVINYRLNYGLAELPSIKGMRTMARAGWQSQACGYFDAIEALDFYVTLQGAWESNESETA